MYLVLPFLLFALGLAPSDAQDPAPAARRVASTITLAAQEYRLGVQDGKVVLQPEVEEAVLFLEEARRTAAALPPEASQPVVEGVARLLTLIGDVAPPDRVSGEAAALLNQLAATLGIALEEVPAQPPLLPLGADIYQRQCASCHGPAGRGDGRPRGGSTRPRPT